MCADRDSGGAVYVGTFSTLALVAIGLIDAFGSILAWRARTLVSVNLARISCET